MTVDDLIAVFEKARAEAAPFPQHHEDGLYAGIAAVVRALRDELSMSKDINSCSACDANYDLFHEILGDAVEKVAGEVEKVTKERDVSWAERKIWITGFNEQEVRAEAAEAERDRLKAALQPFARFAKMFAEAREHRQGHVPVEPNAEWYARETKQGTYILTPGMFDEALSALGDAS